jgi:hypothetical protein
MTSTMTTQQSVTAPSPRQLRKIFSQLGWVAAQQQKAAIELIAYVQQSMHGTFEYAHVPPSEVGGGVARAQHEGELLKRQLLARADMLPPERAAALAGITRQALDLRRKRSQALALTHAKRGYRYPAWQFVDKLAQPMLQLLPQLAHLESWAQYLLLTQPEPLLEGRSVVEALQAGELSAVKRVIEILRQAV